MTMRRLLGILLLSGLVACDTAPVRTVKEFFSASKGAAALEAGLKQYENGAYAESAKNLTAALEQGLNDREQVAARKHLAFIHCVSGRTGACRDEFRKALAVDPALELEPAEAGHPTWGPVFRSVKAGR
jgi:Tfp pilus assembly protein PilF